MEEFKLFIAAGMLIVILIFFSTVVVGRTIRGLEVPGDMARIEQLRQDVAVTNTGSNEDVIGQVTQWNQKISANKQYRKLWWGRLVIPEAWEQVQTIRIPEQQ